MFLKTNMCTEYKRAPPPLPISFNVQNTVSLTSATENEKMCVIFVAGNRKACNLFLIIVFLRRVKKLTPVKLLLEQNGKALPCREIFDWFWNSTSSLFQALR